MKDTDQTNFYKQFAFLKQAFVKNSHAKVYKKSFSVP